MIDSWSKLPIGKYTELYNILGNDDDEDTKILKAAALCNDITYDDILNMQMDAATELVKSVGFVYTAPNKVKPKKHYTLNGRKYRVIKSFGDITTAQYINYQSIVFSLNEHLPEFLAIFFIPDGKKYGVDYDGDEVIEDIKTALCVEEALSLANFFLKRWVKSMTRTLLFYEGIIATKRIMGPKELKEPMKVMEKAVEETRRALEGMYGTLCSTLYQK